MYVYHPTPFIHPPPFVPCPYTVCMGEQVKECKAALLEGLKEQNIRQVVNTAEISCALDFTRRMHVTHRTMFVHITPMSVPTMHVPNPLPLVSFHKQTWVRKKEAECVLGMLDQLDLLQVGMCVACLLACQLTGW